jgi:hypothetical protein
MKPTLLVIVCSCLLSAACNIVTLPDGTKMMGDPREALLTTETDWDYPIKPGTDAWRALPDVQSYWDVCQIPDNVLSSLSTEDLVKLFFRCPKTFEYTAHNSWMFGMQVCYDNFNGFREVCDRGSDSVDRMLKLYLKALSGLPAVMKFDYTASEKVHYKWMIKELEVYLTYIIVNIADTRPMAKDVLIALAIGLEKQSVYNKKNYPDDYIIPDANYFARANVLKVLDADLSNLNEGADIIFTIGIYEQQTADELDRLTMEYIY